ncbi:SDR family oxidoreductase [Flagellatimonas centrodinii]|uniref:SDR family oxidoreductase n=1 Tax=Flagellatimonas centrodinii TaxID=2806210 RepID=UPI001FEEF335|nr:SDR family oxidoreductase [Flagellatimonas centrodinii]ULQ48089.1 SDR family oxidoreductase [Flagellatimonas centrodinii]
MTTQNTGNPAAAPVVLITGAGVRIGAAIATTLHGQGWRVVIHCRHSRAAADALASQLNAQRSDSAQVCVADLLDPAAPAALAARAHAAWGRLDALVNNASSYFKTPLATVSAAQFDDLLGSNLRAPLFLSQACAAFEELRAIINIVDVHARRPRAGYAPYLAAKAGLWTLTEALALELAPRVRVNAVAPGHMIWAVNSAMTAADKAAETARIPLGRLGGGNEIARAVAFLLSDDADYMTGAVLPVDGGLRLG